MKIFFTIAITLLTFIFTIAQERTISGTLTSTDDGLPMPGININIKGTTIGTTTDEKGYYSITAPIGSTLVFSFIGFSTREVLITENSLKPVINGKSTNQKRKSLSMPPSLYQDSIPADKPGHVTLTENSPTYLNKEIIDPATIRSIKRIGSKYIITVDTDPYKRTGARVIFKTSVDLEQANKLPEFQEQYAQGKPDGGNTYQWAGADQSEIFSWGPLLKTLEFDGSHFPFDKNGKLVPVGNGNGNLARKYNPLSSFKKAWSNVNEIMVTLPVIKNSILILDFENRTREGILPNSGYTKNNVSAKLKDFHLFRKVKLNSSVSYISSSGDLLLRGGNLSSVVSSIYRTPVSFDNTNALSRKDALVSSESYKLPGGELRSHAPGFTDNPYGLLNDLPDQEKSKRLISTLNLQFNPDDHLQFIFNGTLENQNNISVFGIAPGYSGFTPGRLTERNDYQTFGNINFTTSYSLSPYWSELKFSLTYQSQFLDRKLHRTDGMIFNGEESFNTITNAESIMNLQRNLSRNSHEIIFNSHYKRENWLNIHLATTSYFSNTIKYPKVNLFPTGSINMNLAELLNLWPIENWNVYGTISRSIREAPLLYSDWSYASTAVPIENYSTFYEQNEIFINSSLSPETEIKFETGTKLMIYSFYTSLSYYNNVTDNFISPLNSTGGFNLANVATVNNYGAIITLGYGRYYHQVNWGIDLKWNKYHSIVRELHSSNEIIPMAGFESVQNVFTLGKPMGSIYGSTYLKNSEGKKVIGNDGFPVEDPTLKMIGNPLPDWILDGSSHFTWKNFKLNFIVEYRKGGDTWNGTQAVLDYLGKSSTTGGLRGIANYVFDGVDVNNNPNTIPVAFSDPTLPLEENRWVRYGWDGVGEAYIEDASVLRLSELSLSYNRNLRRGKINEITIALVGRNLLIRTPYRGVDPSSTLFGYSNGIGLDLFNLPSTRSYGAQITIKI